MKKLLTLITSMVLVLGLFTTGVQAQEINDDKTISYEQIEQMIDQTNAAIYEQIEIAQDKADALVLSKEYNSELDKIIKELLKVTNKYAEKLIEQAEKGGYIVEPAWIQVEIGGRIVSVDPLITDGI
jgi:hypothetical protein